ncbi:hypothetical protein VTL71DRAFT_15659 [Oculimacula yallundae]|uniref:DUF1772-domain-containing protein n=1 Tax=Oculimacula yallundae TaxID=86028 RepID=A0ABR4CIL0_9HELO
MSSTTLLQTLSITTSLLASGSILTLSFFIIPMLQSQPASRSLPQLRWLFSRGSHVFPLAAFMCGVGFWYLSHTSLPLGESILGLFNVFQNSSTTNGYLAAGVLCMSIAPVTSLMIPTNFELIAINENLGGARSSKSAKEGRKGEEGGSAEDSVEGKGDVNEFTDLSGPQGKTDREGSEADERRAKELLGKFKWLNSVRGYLIGAGGVVGLLSALGSL